MLAKLRVRLPLFLQRHLFDISVLFSGVLILAFGVILALQAWNGYTATRQLRAAISVSEHILDATLAQAKERGLVSATLNAPPEEQVAQKLEAAKTERRQHWETVLSRTQAASHWENSAVMDSVQRLREALNGQQLVSTRVKEAMETDSLHVPLDDWFGANSRVIDAGAELRDEILLSVSAPTDISRYILLNRSVSRTTENLGQLRGMLVHFIERDQNVTDPMRGRLRIAATAAFSGVQETLAWKRKPTTPDSVKAALEEFERNWQTNVDDTLRAVMDATANGRYPINALDWFNTLTALIESAKTVSSTSSALVLDRIDATSKRRFAFLMTYGALSILASAFAAATLIQTRRYANRLFMQKELIDTSMRSIADAIVAVDAEGRIRFINPAAEELLGRASSEVTSQHYGDALKILNTVSASQGDPLEACLRNGMVIGPVSDQTLCRGDGQRITVETWAAPVRDIRGDLDGAILVVSDLEGAPHAGHLLSHQANRDSLTDLPNRRAFLRELEQLLDRSNRSHEPVVLGYLDLDQFKVVNDVGGHMAGDRLLQRISFLLKRNIRDSDTLARIGGDEFGLLLRRCDLPRGRRVAEKLLETVDDFRFVDGDRSFRVGVSIGLTEIDARHSSVQEILREVDIACHSAKEKGRNRVEVFHARDDAISKAHETMQWLPRITDALDKGLFAPYCQTIAPLLDGLPPRMEILARLDDTDDEPLGPMGFIPAAERYGLMRLIDRKIFTRVCAAASEQRDVMKEAIFHVNVSGDTISDQDFGTFVQQTVRDYNLSPGHFCFEITETTAISDLESALVLMETLKNAGFTFALDDFGTGVASFQYLKILPVDQIKIDGTFIKNIVQDPTSRAIVRSIVDIARTLSVRTVAEFVESREIADMCRSLGVDYIQGYGVDTPQPLISCECWSGANRVLEH